MNRWNPWWIHNMMTSVRGVGRYEVGLVWRSKSLGASQWPHLSLTPSFITFSASWLPRIGHICSPSSPHHNELKCEHNERWSCELNESFFLLSCYVIHYVTVMRKIITAVYLHNVIFTYSSIGGHLGHSHLLAIMNKATVNTSLEICLWNSVFIYFGYTIRNVESYGNSILIFLKTPHFFFTWRQYQFTILLKV
jgi:hypothetical protein